MDMTSPSGVTPETAKTFERIVLARRSIRGFKPEPVDPALLQRIFRTAQLAPSSCNVQPWAVHVVSGQSGRRLCMKLYAAAREGLPITPDFALTDAYHGVHRERQIGAAKALFEATGIARHDTEARLHSALRNFQFFDAPHAAFIFILKSLGAREIADCGHYGQTLMLALAANGLGSCPQGALSHHAAIVKAELGVPEELHLLYGIAFGHPDDSHPANNTRTTRAALEEATVFHD